jgi:hypothetical protein
MAASFLSVAGLGEQFHLRGGSCAVQTFENNEVMQNGIHRMKNASGLS